jgi:phosphoglycerate dehydrogenase-like enzyme
MSNRVLCLRPEDDFLRVGAAAPSTLAVAYHGPADAPVPALIKSSDALVIPAVGPRLGPELFEGSKLKLVQVTGSGVDRVDQAALTRLGIAVCNVAGGSNSAVAEYVVTTTSSLLRRVAWSNAEIKAGNYIKFRARMIADNLCGIDGLLVGLVGFGTIGRAVARALQALGAKVCFYDPAPVDPAVAASLDARAVSFDELIATCDVISLHVPLIPATQNLIGARELARMKQGAILIQASRGGVVDEAALVASLASGHLGGAAVDVYSTEPPPADNPLLKASGEAASRLILTPHIGGITRQSTAMLFRASWQNVERVLLRKEAPRSRVY